MTLTTDSVRSVSINPMCKSIIPEDEMVGICLPCAHECTITLTDGREKNVILSGEDLCCLTMALDALKVKDYKENHFMEKLDIFSLPSDYGKDYRAILKRAFE